MKFTKCAVRLSTTVIAGMCLAAGPVGIASAEPDPSPSTERSVVAVKIGQPNFGSETFGGSVDCRDVGDQTHPFLVLEPDSHGRNEYRIDRVVTKEAGDGEELMLREHINPARGEFRDENFDTEDNHFHVAMFFVKITGNGGHGSVTIFCAASTVDAHQ